MGSIDSKSLPLPRWEHFTHGADIGVRGIGRDTAEAYALAALAMTAVILEPEKVEARSYIDITLELPDIEIGLTDWLNAVIYEMATRHMLFSDFQVSIQGLHLQAHIGGEVVDPQRHQPAVEVKGATLTELHVLMQGQQWIAQTVVDV